MDKQPQIGRPLSRLEGAEKVTGHAKYSGDVNIPGLLYGQVINSTIAKGKIRMFDVSAALAYEGVVEIFWHENRPSLAWFNMQYADMDAPPGSPFRPLHNDEIVSYGQPIGLVVAETFEQARYAASLVHVEYDEEEFTTDLMANLHTGRAPKVGMATTLKPPPPKPQGDFEKAWAMSDVRASGDFYHGAEHHNPLELFATTTVYEGKGKLTIYDKTQGTVNCQLYVGNVFGLHFKNVRVISTYVGGGFGSGLRPQYQLFMSVMAALQLKKPVRVTLDRSQMFTFGHRPPTHQFTRFGASAEGKVNALHHRATGETSRFEDYTETVVNWAHMLYPADNTLFEYNLVPLDVFSPLDMRAPGGSTAMHAIESTMDELSYKLDMDPLKLRLLNYAETDVSVGRPYSSKELRQCYITGAEKFGWSYRSPEVRSMKRGNKLVGMGMATGIWESMTLPARATAVLTAEGKLDVSSAVTDIGTGTKTVMTQIAADELGMDISDVTFRYGDSKMAFAPIQGGSFTTSSVGGAVKAAMKALKKRIYKKAVALTDSPLKGIDFKDIGFTDGKIFFLQDLSKSIDFITIIAANNGKPIKTTNVAVPNPFKLKKYSRAAHSAAFVEVEVDEELGTVNVTRALTVVAAGTIINPKTARSQILGGMVWSISKALREESIQDHRFGKYMNANLSEYHIPVHADIFDLDVAFVDEKDEIVNELGSKGIGEIGLVGMPPAIANAIYHATGKRLNRFPIHLDELL
ncbi:MAG: xanthine dehydrogenase family protein molybdopterin-binding subunit [Chitinophagaceae bacterium]|nr:MAG: xanthine dehydrogenase family protein molybdopterin-binding subunit [Chitinophagaceae bacterium]